MSRAAAAAAAIHTGGVSLTLRMAILALLVAGGFAAGGCSSPPRCPPGASCPAVVPRVAFEPAINGQSVSLTRNSSPPVFHVRPGKRLLMKVTVIVPQRLTVTALWFGISTGTLGGGPDMTGSLHPILAHYQRPLSAGKHEFRLRWRIPENRAGTSLYLVAAWSSRHPPGNVAQFVARLAVR